MKNHLIFLVLPAALACMPAAAQLNKCAGPDGKLTYSDRQCQVGEKPAAVTAPPIAEPTAREVREARIRQLHLKEHAREIEARRAATPVAGAVGIVAAPERVQSRVGSGHFDQDRCYGVRRELRIAKRMNPLHFDRDIATLELRRAERSYCAD